MQKSDSCSSSFFTLAKYSNPYIFESFSDCKKWNPSFLRFCKFIKNQIEIVNKINNSVKNNNAELVNSLYVKKFNNSSFKNTQLLNNKLNKIKSEEFKPSWKLKYEKVQTTLQQELQKSQVKKAADVGTNTESGFVGIKPVIKVTNPEGFVAIDRVSGGAVKLVDRM